MFKTTRSAAIYFKIELFWPFMSRIYFVEMTRVDVLFRVNKSAFQKAGLAPINKIA